MNRFVVSVLIAGTGASLVACSSSGNAAAPPATPPTSPPRLSAAAYTQELKKIAAEENRAQHSVQSAFHAKTAAAVRQTLGTFADDQQRVSGELTVLVAPTDAQAANLALAHAFADNAAATRAVVQRMAHIMTAKAALHLIQTGTQAQRGSPRHGNVTSFERRKLGYAAGS